MDDTLTLTGYLGKDPEIRETQERTLTRQALGPQLIFEHAGLRLPDRAGDIAEEPAEYDVTVPPRAYAVFSLATHSWAGAKRITTWHRIVVWNVERLEHIGVRIARKGSKVEITGRRTSFETRDGHTLEQIELTNFRILQLR
ncbi:MAG: single-stranded DNA-binding protein [bacterium]|nr:single-stranded DNA-binding protein [bacterium]